MKKARMSKTSLLTGFFFASFVIMQPGYGAEHLLIEAESFDEKGGWVLDQQSFDVIGSSYLLAHGMGVPVPNAVTDIQIDQPGEYQVWVRTKDWAPYPKGPGKFNLIIDGERVDRVFGADGSDQWQWYQGGKVNLESGTLLTPDPNFRPPNTKESLEALRQELFDFLSETEDLKPFDLVVVGGGIAGITTAVTATAGQCLVFITRPGQVERSA